MKLVKTVVLALLIFALSVAANRATGQAQESETDLLIKEFKGDEKAKERRPEQLDAAYAKVVAALLPKMGSEDPNEAKQPQQDLQAICWRASRPGADAERVAVCKAIAAKLTPGLPQATKVWLLLQLERVGRAEAVAAVTALLDDKDPIIRDCARRALEGNPSPEAGASLRAALDKAGTPEWRAALLNALAYRKDRANAEVFMKYATNDDDDVRTAAIKALAGLGDKAAADVIAVGVATGSKRAQAAAADAYLLLADALCKSNDKETALGMYKKLLGSGGHLKCAAVMGVAQAGGIAELPRLMEALADKDGKVNGAAMIALQAMPGNDVTQALAEKAKGAGPELKVMLVRVLSNRGNKSVLPTLIEAAKDANADVRIAAYEGMGQLADDGASGTLVAALVKTKEAEQAAAAAALGRIPGEGVIDAIIKGLSEADPTGRVELIKTLSARKSEKVVPTLLKSAEDADVSVRVESLKALANLTDEKNLPALVAILVKAKDKDQKEAEKAVASVCSRVEQEDKGVGPVIAAFAGADVPVKCSLLRVLGMIGGKKALDPVSSCLKDQNAEIKEATVRSLCDWPNADSASTLLDLARNSQDLKYRVLALRGYVRVVGLPSDRPVEQTLKMLEDGMAAAQRPEDKKLVISGVALVADPGAFKLVKPFLADNALRAEAILAMVKIAEPVSIYHRAEAEAELKAIADTFKDDQAIQKQIKAALERIAQYDDYITAWMLSGPYTEGRKNEKKIFDTEFPPEKADAKGAKWQPVNGGTDRSTAWKTEMDKMEGMKGNNRVCYLQAWIRSDKDQKARLEMGSDDGLKAWLNGEVVDSQNVNRGLAPGSDKVEVTLKKGWNNLRLKVTQGGSQWAACARVRATDGGARPSGVSLMGEFQAIEAAAADLDDEALKTQATEIFPKMARVMVISYPSETKVLINKVSVATKDGALRKQITSLLGETGSFEDGITVWQVSEKYGEGESASALFDKVFPPEKPDHGGAKWSPMPAGAGSKPGLISLDKALGGGSNCVAYVRTYVSSPKKQDVLFEVGSDDGVKVWLNGKVVHANNVARPLKPCEDTVKVTLEEGWNSVLMKITQGGGEWQACARLRDANDGHLDGLKFQAEQPAGVKFEPVPEEPKKASQTDALGTLLASGKLKEALALAEKTRAGLPEGAPEMAALDKKVQEIKDALAKKEKEDRIKETAALQADIPKITAAMPEKPRVAPANPRKLLVYSETHGFRHTACVWGAKTFEIMGKKTGAFEPVVTDDMTMFEPDKIQQFDAVCLNNTTGDIFLPKDFGSLPKDQQEAARKEEAELQKSLTDFVASGKGLIGIHAATDSNYKWLEFGNMMGGYFCGHPWNEKVGVKVDDPEHPLCAAFQGKGFEITDEIYQFKEPYSRDTLRVLLSIDTSKTNMNKGDKIRRKDNDFAVSWIKTYGKGRVFYCSLGHRNEIFWNPMVLQHYLDGIQFALGDLPADTTPSAKSAK